MSINDPHDPLTMCLQHALRRIHGSLSRERRLAGVTCLLVAVFICCYLPFWTVYMCLVRREGGFVKSFPFSHPRQSWRTLVVTSPVAGIRLSLPGPERARAGVRAVADPRQRRARPRGLHRLQRGLQTRRQANPPLFCLSPKLNLKKCIYNMSS